LTFHSYKECLNFLYQRNQFAIKLGLDNIQSLLERRNSPQLNQHYIHVAGTNGKGSVCSYIAQLLPHLGYKRIGLYTSPHLVSFRERILVNGRPVSKKWIVSWLNSAYDAIVELEATYFECTTAMAVEYFHDQGCDMAVMETGLGGRLDATNCLIPQLSIITPVSLDHTGILGKSVSKIWQEKIAILKPGIPVVINEHRKSLLAKIQTRAKELGCPLWNVNDHKQIPSSTGARTRIRGLYGDYPFTTGHDGLAHQLENLRQAVSGLEIFNGGKIIPSSPLGIFRVTEPYARQQVLKSKGRVPVVLDSAHNEGGVKSLSRFIKRKYPDRQTVVLFSIMSDKDYPKILKIADILGDTLLFAELPDYPRCLKFQELKRIYGKRKAPWTQFTVSDKEVKALLESLDPATQLLAVFGSFYLAGRVIPLLGKYYPGLDFFRQFADEK
jgi:dihydrofolate synthase/folylpolyglutamate synthase